MTPVAWPVAKSFEAWADQDVAGVAVVHEAQFAAHSKLSRATRL